MIKKGRVPPVTRGLGWPEETKYQAKGSTIFISRKDGKVSFMEPRVLTRDEIAAVLSVLDERVSDETDHS
jgi:hypothetical protein